MNDQPRIDASTSVALFNDMINANFHTDEARTAAYYGSGVVDAVVRAAARCRELGITVIWVTVNTPPAKVAVRTPVTDRFLREGADPTIGVGEPAWRTANIDELPIEPGDVLLRKTRWDPFFCTPLDLDLRNRGVQTILLGGVSTPGGVESCARSGFDRGYDVVVMEDCTYWVEEDLHEWTLRKALPRVSRVMPQDQAFALVDA